MTRGSLVIANLSGDYGKPRPVLIVQSDMVGDLPSVTVCPLSSTIRDDLIYLRISVKPSMQNGLRDASQIMIDKITTIYVDRVGARIGEIDAETMGKVTRSLAVFLAIV